MLLRSRLACALLVLSGLSACDNNADKDHPTPAGDDNPIPPVAREIARGDALANWQPAPGAPEKLAPAQDEPRSGQLIVHALAGGKAPDKRCEPAIFLTNDTNTALHAAVLRHRWVTEAGEIGDATGSLVVRLAAGKTAFVALAALEQPCAQLTLKVENLSCRDDQAQPGQCPGSLQGQSFGMKGLQLP